jgi:ApbE superfamily uncharacterized protein (UPF0280 family)
MSAPRRYRTFTHREAVLRICCDRYEAVTVEVARLRAVLEEYIRRHPAFGTSLSPLTPRAGAPGIVRRMAAAARRVDVGPMAAVAGAVAEGAARAGLAAGAREAVVENGGDVYAASEDAVRIGLYAGAGGVAGRLAFRIPAEDLPLAVCSSSGTMGHSLSLGACDLATVVAREAALADAAATRAANLVRGPEDIDGVLERIGAVPGILGVLVVKDDRVGMIGRLPELVRA